MAIKYDNCKNCHSLCIHAGKDREFVCINGVSCKITMEKPQTNAQKIRAMSDEELADMLWKTGRNYRAVCADPVVDYNEHRDHLISWLKQPAE